MGPSVHCRVLLHTATSDSWDSVDAKNGLTHLDWTPDTRKVVLVGRGCRGKRVTTAHLRWSDELCIWWALDELLNLTHPPLLWGYYQLPGGGCRGQSPRTASKSCFCCSFLRAFFQWTSIIVETKLKNIFSRSMINYQHPLVCDVS